MQDSPFDACLGKALKVELSDDVIGRICGKVAVKVVCDKLWRGCCQVLSINMCLLIQK